MKKIFFLILLILVFTSFYKINELNYIKTVQVKRAIVEHPENLATKETAKNSTFGFSNIRADLYWLQAIQYIGSNAISSEYKKYLFAILDVITELNPYFEHPYIIGELLLPSYNEKNETLSKEEQELNTKQAIEIGLKGVNTYCNSEKLNLIKQEFNLNKIWTEEQYKNPCKSYKIPYNLAFVYYFYAKDPETASFYYKVSSANEDSLQGAKLMSAIMQGKGGNREKAFFMFLNMASTVEQENEVCSQFSDQLNSLALNGQLKNDSYTVKQIEETKNKLFPRESTEDESGLSNAQCANYLNKAIRELNLSYIEAAHQKYLENNSKPLGNALELKEKGYIDFLPTDPQNNPDEEYGIIYSYDEELGHFDYERGKY